MIQVLETDEVRSLYDKHWYPEALYLLAMVDASMENLKKGKASKPIDLSSFAE